MRWWLALCASFVFAACGGGHVAQPSAAADLSPQALYPLEKGWAWSYDVDAGEGQTVLATARVLRSEAGSVAVQSGQEVLNYQLAPEGIAREHGFFLLRAPITASAAWQSGPDTQARVAALGERVTTPAGSFESCVTVREDHPGSGQQVTTTYCPGVGPVRIDSQMQVRGRTVSVHATLRGFTAEAEAE